MVRYWKEEYREPVTLTDKRFNELRQLYIDCFETLCRLLVLARGYEMIVQHGILTRIRKVYPRGRKRKSRAGKRAVVTSRSRTGILEEEFLMIAE